MWLRISDDHLANLEQGTFIVTPVPPAHQPAKQPHPLFFIDASKTAGLRVTPLLIDEYDACRARLDEHADRLNADPSFARHAASHAADITDPARFADLGYDGPPWLAGHQILINPRHGHRIVTHQGQDPAQRSLLFVGPQAQHHILKGSAIVVEAQFQALAHYLGAGTLIEATDLTVKFTKKRAHPTPESDVRN